MKILFLNMLSVSFFTTVFIGVFCLVCRVVNRRWISALTWTVGIFVGLRLLAFVPVPLPYTVTFPEGMQMELPKTLLEQRREEYLEEKEREKLEAQEDGQRQGESTGAWLTRQAEAQAHRDSPGGQPDPGRKARGRAFSSSAFGDDLYPGIFRPGNRPDPPVF